jgi:hypothetical protein
MKKSKDAPESETDPVQVRNQLVDSLIGSSFQLAATGTIFSIGSEFTPSWEDILFTLNRLYTTGYVEEYKLLPYNVPPAILISGLTKDVVAWLVPMLINAIDRKVMGQEIDPLSPNNKALVGLADVLGWYWYKYLHGPKPVIKSLVVMQRPTKMVQNAALICPLCYHQFKPASSYSTQQERVHAFAKWLPTHFSTYHHLHDTHKANGTAKCQCNFCTGKTVQYSGNSFRNKKRGTK